MVVKKCWRYYTTVQWLAEETGYERWQTPKIKTKGATVYVGNALKVQDKNYRNAIEHCALSRPQETYCVFEYAASMYASLLGQKKAFT